MLNIILELGQILSLVALACGAFLCIRESESLRLIGEYLQSRQDRQRHPPAQREQIRAMTPRINGV